MLPKNDLIYDNTFRYGSWEEFHRNYVIIHGIKFTFIKLFAVSVVFCDVKRGRIYADWNITVDF
jgi:hypothetical protein